MKLLMLLLETPPEHMCGFFVVSTGLLQVHDDLFYMDVPDVLMIQDIYMMHWT